MKSVRLFVALPLIGAALTTSALLMTAQAASAGEQVGPIEPANPFPPSSRAITQPDRNAAGASGIQSPFVTARVNQSQSWVNGEATAGTVVTITLRRAGIALDTQTRTANDSFFIGFNKPNTIQTGDVVELRSSIGVTASIDVIRMS